MIADDQRHPVDLLADEFAERLRSGESVSIDDYAVKHPDLADVIRAVFPPIEVIERARLHHDSKRQTSVSGQPGGSSAVACEALPVTPQRLGDFHIVREIGRGGMGVVYEAEQQSLKRRVALKVMSGVTADAGNRRERFRREAEAAAVLHHTNIVGVFGIGEESGFLYYAMQLIHGVPLSNVIQKLRSGRLNNVGFQASSSTQMTAITRKLVADDKGDIGASRVGDFKTDDGEITLDANYFQFVARLIASAASGLQYAHHAGILHRDIKPSNLMLDHEGTLWITDFGVAKRESLDDMTQTGEIVGTLRYMAPEQLRGTGDHRSDIYSLGLTLIELLTLRPAITSTTGRWLEATARGPIQRPRSVRKEVPYDLDLIAMKAVAVEPGARYASAAALESDLRNFLEDRPIIAKKESVVSKLRRTVRRNPVVSVLAMSSLLLLSVIAVMFAYGNHQKQAALEEIATQFQRAEKNLQEKTEALMVADRERNRAETNLKMAIEAFESVITNIGSRGGVEALVDDLIDDDAVVSVADSGLSEADVQLLENLLVFFDRFAVENETDLNLESATAKRRLGDIYQRLGRFEEADQAYQKALRSYQAMRIRPSKDLPSDVSQWIREMEIFNELMTVAANRGHAGEVLRYFNLALELAESNGNLKNDAGGQFAIAKLHATLAALGSRLGRENRSRFAQMWSRRDLNGRGGETFLSQVSKKKLDREQTANTTANELLESLLASAPDNVAYRITLARVEREEIRLAQAVGDKQRAKEAHQRSITLFENLAAQFPESLAFKYELVRTLRAGLRFASREFQTAIRVCDELVQADPDSVDYRALRSSIYARAAALTFSGGQQGEAIRLLRLAIEDQRYLALRFPEVFVYRLAAAQSMSNLAEALAQEGDNGQAQKLLEDAMGFLAAGRMSGRAAPLLQRLEQRRDSLVQE